MSIEKLWYADVREGRSRVPAIAGGLLITILRRKVITVKLVIFPLNFIIHI